MSARRIRRAHRAPGDRSDVASHRAGGSGKWFRQSGLRPAGILLCTTTQDLEPARKNLPRAGGGPKGYPVACEIASDMFCSAWSTGASSLIAAQVLSWIALDTPG